MRIAAGYDVLIQNLKKIHYEELLSLSRRRRNRSAAILKFILNSSIAAPIAPLLLRRHRGNLAAILVDDYCATPIAAPPG